MYLIYVSDICIQHMMTVAGVKFLTPASPRCLLQGFAWKASQVSHSGKLTPSMLATRLCMEGKSGFPFGKADSLDACYKALHGRQVRFPIWESWLPRCLLQGFAWQWQVSSFWHLHHMYLIYVSSTCG